MFIVFFLVGKSKKRQYSICHKKLSVLYRKYSTVVSNTVELR